MKFIKAIKLTMALIAAFAAMACSAIADEITTVNPTNNFLPNAVEAQIRALRNAVDVAETNFLNHESDATWKQLVTINDKNVPAILTLAKQAPQSAMALNTFEWLLSNERTRIMALRTNGYEAILCLRDYQAKNPDIAKICRTLGNKWNWDSTFMPLNEFLQKAADQNPNREVRGQAWLALGNRAKDRADILLEWEGDTNTTLPWFQQHHDFIVKQEADGGSRVALAQAQKFYQKVLDEYQDCPSLADIHRKSSKATLGEIAEIDLFELEHLMIGDQAPELTGKDINGNELNLRDYRGKVVLLSFWASWCGPCMQMIPSEVELAKRMQGKPFALIGVNADDKPEDAMAAVKKEGISWPSFWNTNGSDGAIPTAWNIHGWPTVFVLDENGVIQFRDEGYGGTNTDNLLAQKIDALVHQPNQNHLN